MAVYQVKEAGGAMGLFNFLLMRNGEACPRRMPASMALSWCMASWRAYCKVKDDAALKTLAEEDLRDSTAVALVNVIAHFAASIHGSAFVWDNALFKFVALLYLSRCLRNSKDCWNHLRGFISSERLRAFSSFGLGLVAKLDNLPRGNSLTHSLDKLYPDWQQVLDEIVHSDYVFLMPARHEGPARSRLLDGIRDKALRDEVAAIYVAERDTNKWNAREHTETAKEEYVMGRDLYGENENLPLEDWSRYCLLTVGQGLELLQAIEKNKLLDALVTQRPPNSVLISHFTAILDCTEHARLFLARSELAVYYNLPDLKYLELASPLKLNYSKLASPDCTEALKSPLGLGARVPSPLEKLLRRLAVDAVADVDEAYVHEAPRSFLTAPPGSGFGKLKSVPVSLEAGDKAGWFPKFVRVVRAISTCEPVQKLRYLVGAARANTLRSMFVDVARATKLINWAHLTDPGADDRLVYKGSSIPPRYLQVLL